MIVLVIWWSDWEGHSYASRGYQEEGERILIHESQLKAEERVIVELEGVVWSLVDE